VLEKRARNDADGSRNWFVDPAAFATLMAQLEADFESRLP
jgi:hypothetical protein